MAHLQNAGMKPLEQAKIQEITEDEDEHQHQHEEEEEEEEDWFQNMPTPPTPAGSAAGAAKANPAAQSEADAERLAFEKYVAQIKREDAEHLAKVKEVEADLKVSGELSTLIEKVAKEIGGGGEEIARQEAKFRAQDEEIAKKETTLVEGEYRRNPVAARRELKALMEKRHQLVRDSAANQATIFKRVLDVTQDALSRVRSAIRDFGPKPNLEAWRKQLEKDLEVLNATNAGNTKRRNELLSTRSKMVEDYQSSIDQGDKEMQRYRNESLALMASQSGEQANAKAKELEKKALEKAQQLADDAKRQREEEEAEIARIREEIRKKEEEERQARIRAEEKRRQEEEARRKQEEERLRKLKEEQEQRERARRSRCPSGMHAWDQYCYIVNAPWRDQVYSSN